MRISRIRITIARMMAAVAIIALVLGAVAILRHRAHFQRLAISTSRRLDRSGLTAAGSSGPTALTRISPWGTQDLRITIRKWLGSTSGPPANPGSRSRPTHRSRNLFPSCLSHPSPRRGVYTGRLGPRLSGPEPRENGSGES